MHKQDGYMIVELLVTLIVGGILILSLNSIVSSHTYLTQRGRDLSVANSFAEQKFESARSIGYLGLTIGTTDITSELPSELKAPRSATQTITSQSSALKKVYISITYSEQGTPRSSTYAGYIGELGVGQY